MKFSRSIFVELQTSIAEGIVANIERHQKAEIREILTENLLLKTPISGKLCGSNCFLRAIRYSLLKLMRTSKEFDQKA